MRCALVPQNAPSIANFLSIANLHLTTASPRLLATVKMLIPKADRKAIHELVLHTIQHCGATELGTFTRNIQS